MVATRRCLVALLALSSACASSNKSAAAAGNVTQTAARTTERQNPDVISQEELLDPAIVSLDLGTAIRRLRPGFFRTSGPQSFSNASAGQVQYSHDFGPLQPISQLRSMNSMSLVEIRYLGVNEAANRFGLNANGGPVIVLLSNKQQP
jgi:hypothetical protein